MGKRRALSEMQMKQIATWAVMNPEMTQRELALKFNCSEAQVRYSFEKFGDVAVFSQNTRSGRKALTQILADTIDNDENIMREELKNIIAKLMVDSEMESTSKLQLLNMASTIKVKLQKVSMQNHMRDLDARTVAAIIRRYEPNASDEDIIKIYKEERKKLG
jgi:hypothetical protein